MVHAPMAADTIVFDLDMSWSTLATSVSRVAVAAPESAESLDPTSAQLVVNLGTPGAFDAIAALQRRAKVWGVINSEAKDRCLPVGQVVVAAAGHELSALRAITPHSGRRRPTILLVGGEVDPTIALWANLTREGLSVTVAWDSAQVSDLIEMVAPDAVVIGAGGMPRGGAGFLGRLPGLRRPPTLVLLPGDDAERFAIALRAHRAAGAEMTHAAALEHFGRRAAASTAGLTASAAAVPSTLAA